MDDVGGGRERGQSDRIRSAVADEAPVEKTGLDAELEDMNQVIRAALDEGGEITWTNLLKLARWRALSAEDPNSEAAKKHLLAARHYSKMIEVFKQGLDGDDVDVGLLPPVGGVYRKTDGSLHITIRRGAISFDWSEAQPLLPRIDDLAEKARDWWPRKRSASHLLKRLSERQQALFATERQPHSVRAYGLATGLLTLLDQENGRTGDSQSPSPDFAKELKQLRGHAEEAERQFHEAAARSAQVRYGRGMLGGMAALIVFSALIGFAFLHWDVRAEYGVAFLAGGLGAIVSVLQRMGKNRLLISNQGAPELIRVIGAMRPWIGGIFGIVVAAVIQSKILPVISEPEGSGLAFYTVVGFLAGFNERFAQDMLSNSSKSLAADTAPGEDLADRVDMPRGQSASQDQ
jgi:hypothetical protein